MLGKMKRDLPPREKSFFYLRAFTVALLLGSILPQHTLARTWYVKADGTGDAPTIQAGVDSAAVGDTVLVGPGTYSDTTHVMVGGTLRAVNVHLQKQVSLLGDPSEDRPFIDGVHSYVGIFVEATGSVISIGHLKLKGTAFLQPAEVDGYQKQTEADDIEYPARIRCHSASVELEGILVSNDNYGVFLWNSVATICDSELHTLTSGVFAYDGSNATVYNNYIFDGPVGVECDHSSANVTNNVFGAPPLGGQTVGIYCSISSVEVRGNIMRWSNGGLAALQSQIVFDGNKLSNMSGAGVSVGSSSSAVITNNTFYTMPYAIYSWSGTTGEISNNTIDKCPVGIISEIAVSQQIRNNIISRGGWGIQCVNSSLIIECNDIFDMGSGPYDIDLCSGQPGEGNFFEDPEYCGIDDSGNYFLQSDSPCAPGNHPLGTDCGLIGALPVNCGQVETRRSTWGSIKGKFTD